jgi:ParB family chromosome partitioning protein
MNLSEEISGQATPLLIDIALIVSNPFQVRQAEDPVAVAELSDNITRNGLLQPPTVRPWKDVGLASLDPKQNVPMPIRLEGYGYQLAFGHTRVAAFKYLAEQGKNAFRQIPCFVKDLDDLQMFELAVAENIKRRDLNPIERARAMQTYMETFKKTSAETGEFFNVDEATVRGSVRLLGLPEIAQEKLATGEMTVGVARRLLTIQRVSGQKATDETVKKLAVDNADTEFIVNEGLKKNIDTVEMWSSWRSEESPRAGVGLWPLGTPPNKLPNNLLPELTKSDAYKIFEWTGKKDGIDGAPLAYPELLKQLKVFPGQAQSHITNEDSPSWVDLVERTIHLIEPPACTACSYYAKVDKGHYCGFAACYQRKVIAFSKAELAKLVKKLEIPAYDPEVDGKATFVLKKDWNNESRHQKLFDAKTDVRLRSSYTSAQKNYSGKHDCTDSYLVQAIVVGKTAQKLIEKRKKENAERNVATDNSERERRWKIESSNRTASDKLIHLAAPIFAAAFQSLGAAPIKALLGGGERKDKVEALRVQLAERALNTELPWKFKENGPIASGKHLQGVAKTWGIDLPKEWMDRAQELTEGLIEYEGLNGKPVVVSTETKDD